MKTFTEVPNLDAMDQDELFEFKQFLQHKEAACIALLGDCADEWPILNLWHYVINKRSAIRYRLDGDITSALECESECDTFYKRLPDSLKW